MARLVYLYPISIPEKEGHIVPLMAGEASQLRERETQL